MNDLPPPCPVCAPAPDAEDPCLRCAILWLLSPELEEWSACGSTPEDFERAWLVFVERTRADLASRLPCLTCGFWTNERVAGRPLLCAGCRDKLQPAAALG